MHQESQGIDAVQMSEAYVFASPPAEGTRPKSNQSRTSPKPHPRYPVLTVPLSSRRHRGNYDSRLQKMRSAGPKSRKGHQKKTFQGSKKNFQFQIKKTFLGIKKTFSGSKKTLRLKSVNSDRDRKGPGRNTQNCRHLWTRIGSSRLKSVNRDRDRKGPGRKTQNCQSLMDARRVFASQQCQQ